MKLNVQDLVFRMHNMAPLNMPHYNLFVICFIYIPNCHHILIHLLIMCVLYTNLRASGRVLARRRYGFYFHWGGNFKKEQGLHF